MIQLAYFFAVLLGFAHYFSESFCLKSKSFGGASKVVSLFAGISVTYILLDLFPSFSEQVLPLNKLLFLSLLSGVVIFHVVERVTYLYGPKDKIMRDIALEQSTTFFIYHVLVGIALVGFVKLGLYKATLFFIPIFLYSLIGSLITKPPKDKSWRLFLASGAFIGVVIATAFYPNINPFVQLSLLGFVIGSLFYIVLRHSIPSTNESQPFYFLAGSIIYSALIIFGWLS